MSRLMNEGNFKTVSFEQRADVYVINTCSVTDNADKKCRRVIRKALSISPDAFVVVTGCYAQLKPKEITEIEGVDLVLGAAEKFNLLEHLTDLVKRPCGAYIAGEIGEVNDFVSAFSVGERTRSFLKIQDGCDYKCAFCTIPLARGKSRSDSVENVLQNAQSLAQSGVREIVLTGVNIGDYGKHIAGNDTQKITFFELVKALDEQVPVSRFRISSIEPNLLTDEIINFVAQSERFMPHFHIPLQSGSDKMLTLMRRRYRRNLYAERVASIKRAMPHACIGVDVIVGHPGETHEDFLDTYRFLNELEVSYLHVFTYSERSNTHALSIRPIVPVAERRERSAMLRILSDKKRAAFYRRHLNTQRPALFEAETDGNIMHGFTDNYIKVETNYNSAFVNKIRNVQLYELSSSGAVSTLEACAKVQQ